MRRYPSKILLFGEYILLLGQRALATPVPAFSGWWAHSAVGEPAPRADALLAFARSAALAALDALDTGRFAKEVAAGLFFESNIPVGYGLGSSGALCAGVYDRYAVRKSPEANVLQAIFSSMESYFHGKSSGIDPLTSYLNRPLWVNNRQEVVFFQAPVWTVAAPVVFLLDTKAPRQTGPLVAWFLDQSEHPAFTGRLESDYYPAHQALLNAWETGDDPVFWQALHQVSLFQLMHFQPMIPEHLRGVWSGCLSGGQAFLKICGAGGGGYMLGFAKNKAAVQAYLGNYEVVFPFEQHAMVEK